MIMLDRTKKNLILKAKPTPKEMQTPKGMLIPKQMLMPTEKMMLRKFTLESEEEWMLIIFSPR
jgi:hypothetical protein